MDTGLRWLALPLLTMLVVAACSGAASSEPTASEGTAPPRVSDTVTPAPGATPPPTPTRAPAYDGPTPTPAPEAGELGLPETGVGLYLAVSVRSNSDLFRIPGGGTVNLESSTRAVSLYLPDSGEHILVDAYTAPKYAPYVKRPYTVDGRLFIVRHATDSGDQSYSELDPATLDARRVTRNSGRSDDANFAVAGDYVFYLTDPKTGPFRPEPRIELKRMALDGTALDDIVLDPSAAFLRRGDLMADDGNVYWVTKQENEIGFFLLDQTTGELDPLELFVIDDDSENLSWSFAIDGGTFYWAILRDDAHVELWRFDPKVDALATVMAEVPLPGGIEPRLVRLDADSGHLAVWLGAQPGDDSEFILFDTKTGRPRIIDTGMPVFDFQLRSFER